MMRLKKGVGYSPVPPFFIDCQGIPSITILVWISAYFWVVFDGE